MAPRTRFLITAAGLSLLLLYGTLSVGVSWAHLAATLLGRRDLWDAGDFATLYSAARLVATGRAGDLYILDALTSVRVQYTQVYGADRIAYLNPPFFAAMLAPLAHLGFARAYQVWTAVGVLVALATCALVWREANALSRWQRVALIGALLTSYPLAFGLRLGQFSPLLMASWTASYVLLRRGRGRAAGVALAVLLIKPELLLPPAALLLWKRRYDVFSTLIPITVLAVAASFAIVGPTEGLRYPAFILSNARDYRNGTHTEFMFGWNGWFGALLGKEEPLRTTLLSLPFGVITLAGAALAWRRWDPRGPAFATQWLLLTVATLLADPNLFLQDIIIVMPALIIGIATWAAPARSAGLFAAAVGWLLASLGLDPGSFWHFNVVTTELIAGAALLSWWTMRGQAWTASTRSAEPAGASDADNDADVPRGTLPPRAA